jgi:hypothetical protein
MDGGNADFAGAKICPGHEGFKINQKLAFPY